MQDTTELYWHLLGLTQPWKVSRVELSAEKQQVDVFVKHPVAIPWKCPQCPYQNSVYDHAEERTWRHLDSCHFQTLLHAKIPRIKCPEHGVLQVSVPWAEPRSRFTLLFERLTIEVLRQSTVQGASEILRQSWAETMLLMQRAVARGRKREEGRPLPETLGIDEKHTTCGVLTLVNDVDGRRVLQVIVEAKKEPLQQYLGSYPEAQRKAVKAVAIDMSDTFYGAVAATIPDSADKIVYDRFHVMQLVGKAVNEVRKQEHSYLLRKQDDRLKGTRYLFCYSDENLPEDQRERLEQLKADKLATGRAWALKEFLRTLWSCTTRSAALQAWKKWSGWAKRSRLEPMQDVARRLGARLYNILTFVEHRVTNAISEGLNSAISTLLRRAYGYRNLQNQITAIYFYQGKLDLMPELATHAKVG
jgi:transposase